MSKGNYFIYTLFSSLKIIRNFKIIFRLPLARREYKERSEMYLPVTAAASLPSSLTSMKAFCTTLLIFKGTSEMPVKSALLLNGLTRPICRRKIASKICRIYLTSLSAKLCGTLLDNVSPRSNLDSVLNLGKNNRTSRSCVWARRELHSLLTSSRLLVKAGRPSTLLGRMITMLTSLF